MSDFETNRIGTAVRITKLEAELARMVEALCPFADESLHADQYHEFVTVKRYDCDKDAAALAAAKAVQHG